MPRSGPLPRRAGGPNRGKKSDTDYWFDSQIARMTAEYEDTTVTTERTNDGIVTSRVADRSGNVGASLTVRSTVLQYAPTVGAPFLAANDSSERPTLDAASRQAYSLWKDGTSRLRWRRGLMQPATTTRDWNRACCTQSGRTA